MAAEETGFEINGKTYPIPALDTLNMDEAQVLYDTSGLAIEDFMYDPSDDQPEDRRQKMKNPGVIRALIQIAYARGNPDAKLSDVLRVTGGVNWVSAVTDMLRSQQEDDALPPAETTEPARSSPSGSVSSPPSSGDGSANGSDEQDGQHEPTGLTRLGTSRTSPPAPDRTVSVG